ncbi:16S rRNA (guanine(527)-N(7))-methyltransferase RsmG [Helicobacter mustelae]|uniref:Ribosomal RNA small subunit methyltransferase G n=1 Tax=Helicobacter mustelae (strain ATCC 43772 / CCUG 25715 / CIP 103759 / LMG 18044 / NCTC 12198 / R85-136P) TaxID=679897 RepID=D3UFV4_HELM1|nr:16S rRNA (guanine(527)-N(7))-methyltransferase RsmG [Helicobacter mustelae]CBG39375.1 glucose-inhibited division protein B; GidB [Helicobacter mustelae 12198]SQH70888.1 glucose-inhibited division protein B [Helicobacter mustelae]
MRDLHQEAFLTYINLLLEWNQIHNLSGNLTPRLAEEYLLDSIYPLEFIQSFSRCIDVGSGAGFPAVPLAICCPRSEFLLIEPRNKRAAFLQYVSSELGLSNIQVKKMRIEEVGGRCVDLITSRAVMDAPSLIASCSHLLQVGGHYLFYKGENLSQELGRSVEGYPRRGQRIYFYERKES